MTTLYKLVSNAPDTVYSPKTQGKPSKNQAIYETVRDVLKFGPATKEEICAAASATELRYNAAYPTHTSTIQHMNVIYGLMDRELIIKIEA